MQRGRAGARRPFQAATSHWAVDICRPASVGVQLRRSRRLGTMQDLSETFERQSGKFKASHASQDAAPATLAPAADEEIAAEAPERRAGKRATKKRTVEQPTRPAAKAKPAGKAVDKGEVQFVTLFGAVCYPFGISAYQRCIRNPDTSVLYQKKYVVSAMYQRCISDVSVNYVSAPHLISEPFYTSTAPRAGGGW